MAGFSVSVDAREVDRVLRGLTPQIERKVLRKALRETANKAKTKLVSGTPFRTGFARRQVRVSVRVTKAQATAKVKYKGRSAMVMRIYERGSMRQVARPYFRAAAGGFEQEAVREFMASLREVVAAARAAA